MLNLQFSVNFFSLKLKPPRKRAEHEIANDLEFFNHCKKYFRVFITILLQH